MARIVDHPIFLKAGKYFLIVLVLAGQGFLAWQVVDKNYEKIFLQVNRFMPEKGGSYQLGELVVNPSGTNGQRFLIVEIGLDLADKEHIQRIQSQEQRIRHEMNEILSSRTIDQLVRYEEREEMRLELARIVNRVVGTGSVRNLYYTRFVIQ